MNILELVKRINLIVSFTAKMNNASIPYSTQKIFVKLYANDLKFNLSDRMIENILQHVS